MIDLGTSLFLRRCHVKFKVMLNIVSSVRFSGSSHVSVSPVKTTIKNIHKPDLKFEKHVLSNINKKILGHNPSVIFVTVCKSAKVELF